MVLWRISRHTDIDGIGGLLAGGRWHHRGQRIVYCSAQPATALLETLVHMEIDSADRPVHFQLLKLETPASVSVERIAENRFLNKPDVCQNLGDEWLASQRSLILEVPSILIPETWNLLINPLHPEARSIKLKKIYKHPFDSRLF